jgi:thiamine pyrophosphokinase
MQIIVFTGGEAPKPSEAAAYFKNILAEGQKPNAVIAADSGLETLRAYKKHFNGLYDFSPSLILGDFDSISDKKILNEYDSAIIERSPSYKDDTDTELALKRARELAQNKELSQDQKAFITLIGGAGGRPDHFLSIYNLFGTKIAPDAWLCGKQILYKAERSSFEISGLKTGDVISVARAFGKNHGGKIRSQGLEWESSLFRKKGMPSVSNTIKEEWARLGLPVKIDFLRGSFVLIAPLFASVRLNKGSTKI